MNNKAGKDLVVPVTWDSGEDFVNKITSYSWRAHGSFFEIICVYSYFEYISWEWKDSLPDKYDPIYADFEVVQRLKDIQRSSQDLKLRSIEKQLCLYSKAAFSASNQCSKSKSVLMLADIFSVHLITCF